MLRSTWKRFRTISLLEGTSFLLLLGVAMPLKYLAGIPQMVTWVGWAHGLLFVLYLFSLLEVTVEDEWGWRRLVAGGAAAVLPFGPFVFDRWLASQRDSDQDASAKKAQPMEA